MPWIANTSIPPNTQVRNVAAIVAAKLTREQNAPDLEVGRILTGMRYGCTTLSAEISLRTSQPSLQDKKLIPQGVEKAKETEGSRAKAKEEKATDARVTEGNPKGVTLRKVPLM